MLAHQVLVVADDDFSLSLMADLLEANDVQTHRARSSKEALSLARTKVPAMVLVDASAGSMAEDVIRGLKRQVETREIPVMALGSEDPSALGEILATCSASVSRPIDTAAFPRQVMRELRRHTTNPGRVV